MEKFKKYGMKTLVLIAALLVNLIICIFLHSYVMAVVEDPFTIEGLTEVFEDQASSQILDTFKDGDSALVLLKKEDKTVFLLEFHKNLFLNRYQILDVINIPEDKPEFSASVKTVFRNYPVTVQNQQNILLESQIGFHLNFSNFFLLYLMNVLLLTVVEYIVYNTGKKYKKAKAAAKKK